MQRIPCSTTAPATRKKPAAAVAKMTAGDAGASSAAVIDTTALRHVLGHFASGVVVVTADTPDGPVGMTCQSFSSLSLDPPLVLFCPRKGSWAWAKIRAVGHFGINILHADQVDTGLAFSTNTPDQFTGVAHRRAGRTGAPLLQGVLGWIECELAGVHDGGDHDIAVGRIVDLATEDNLAPLIFYRGGFGRLAP